MNSIIEAQIDLGEEVQKEYERCKNSPYYFAVNYLLVDGKPFETPLEENLFNKYYNSLSSPISIMNNKRITIRPYVKQTFI